MNWDRFADRVDVNYKISLLEYGVIRNPDSGFTIFSRRKIRTEEGSENFRDYHYDWSIIEKQDVLDELEDMPKGFYDCVGTPKEKYLAEISEDYLAHVIMDLQSYCNPWDYMDYRYRTIGDLEEDEREARR